jgi:hypothetical protein
LAASQPILVNRLSGQEAGVNDHPQTGRHGFVFTQRPMYAVNNKTKARSASIVAVVAGSLAHGVKQPRSYLKKDPSFEIASNKEEKQWG